MWDEQRDSWLLETWTRFLHSKHNTRPKYGSQVDPRLKKSLKPMETRPLFTNKKQSNLHCSVLPIIIQISYTVEILIFWSADLYYVILGCDKKTALTSLSWCNSRGVNSTHHCHYTMASADSNILVSMQCFSVQCINLHNKNVKSRYCDFSFIFSELVQLIRITHSKCGRSEYDPSFFFNKIDFH